MSGELASERWSPAQRVESVLISILSLLDDAEVSSPANVDAGVLLRKSPEKYKETVHKCVEESKADIPDGYEMPTHESTSMTASKIIKDDDSDFWAESDVDDDMFGGSGSDQEEMDSDDFEEQDDDDDDTGSDEEPLAKK
jgi:ubiquitin-conjugating enzyme E2 R